MKILALETSSAAGSIAVLDGDRLLAERRFSSPRGRGAEIFAALEELRGLWTGAERVAVGLGPGSYNGLRTACALAGSFRTALGVGLTGLPSVCALDVAQDDYTVCGDARGGRVFWARIRARRLAGEIELPAVAELPGLWPQEPVPVYRLGAVHGAEHLPEARPDAVILARLAAREPAGTPDHLEPLYLKPPHITQPRSIVA